MSIAKGYIRIRNTAALLAALLLLSGCATPIPQRPSLTQADAVNELLLQPPAAPADFTAKMTIHFCGIQAPPMIVAGSINAEERSLELTGLSTAGTFLFQTAIHNGEILSSEISPLAPALCKKLFTRIALDLYCAKAAQAPAGITPSIRNGRAVIDHRGTRFIFAGEPLTLWHVIAFNNNHRPLWGWRKMDHTGTTWEFRDRAAGFWLEMKYL